MLFRVSGKLNGNIPFSSRVEAASAIEAITSVGQKLVAASKPLTDVRSIVAQPVKESADIYLGEGKTDAQLADAKAARKANKDAKAAKVAAPAPVDSAPAKGKK